ncbi:MAG TPA: MoxR family ATPase [Chthonomonadaceae bacterium]|nr:MoxR family ATPase [Chthonomonadaceae bacterium]
MSDIERQTGQFAADFQRVRSEIGKVIVGNEPIVDGVLTCLMIGGHVLLEGVPGLGKTLLVRTLSEAVHLKFSRIQFTPDLMPADITGTNILIEGAAGQKEFRFQAGPVFANIVLADEINRATPKTQSAMLEAMQEHSVTVAGTLHRLSEPFFVLATQNPIEMEGTYPLPEAQLDRFLFKLLVTSPTFEDLSAIVDRTTGTPSPPISPVLTGETILQMRALAREVPLAPKVREFAIKVVLGTHPDSPHAPAQVKQFVRFGSSPRGAQAVVTTAKVRALLDGRYNVALEDIVQVAIPALRHRLILNFEGQAEGIAPDTLVQAILDRARAESDVKIGV